MAQPPFFFGEIATKVRSLNGEQRGERQFEQLATTSNNRINRRRNVRAEVSHRRAPSVVHSSAVHVGTRANCGDVTERSAALNFKLLSSPHLCRANKRTHQVPPVIVSDRRLLKGSPASAPPLTFIDKTISGVAVSPASSAICRSKM